MSVARTQSRAQASAPSEALPRVQRGVALLGSTGSIGRSTLDVLRRQGEHFRLWR